ncbi:MAG: extracellular solute-binding protein, partial [Spirochaetia bacterium]
FLAFLGGSAPRLAARSDTIVLSVWSFSDEVKKFVDRFENTYHGVKFDLTIIPYEEYLNKLKSAMKSGKNLPDLFTGEYGQIKEIVESGYWEDLSAAPYKADVSDMFPYLVQVGTDSKGKLRGLSWQITPGGFYFRRSAARKYLGTDVPENIGKMISTPEKFLATARRLKKKSGGKVKMIAGYSDYMQYPFAARTGPFVAKNNRLTIEPPIRDYFDMAKTMHDEGLTAGITMWSPPWFKMMYSDDPEFLGFFLPPWGLHYVIKPNAHDTDGDWGLCRGPGSFFWGGTWMGICSRSKYKKAAWEFLKFCTLDRENLRWWAKKTGDVVSSISVCKKIQANFSDPLLNGQNHYKFFTEQALRLKDSFSTPHTLEIQNYMQGAVKEYVNGKLNNGRRLINGGEIPKNILIRM